MTGADVEVWTPTGLRTVDLAVRFWGQASMVPAQYVDNGRVKWPDLTLAGLYCNALDADPMLCIKDTYVIKGRVGLMADLQEALALRDGYDVGPIEATADRATVRIVDLRGQAHLVTVTMAEAKTAGWTKRAKADVPSNYETIPDRMLRARATTKAISQHAPGVLRGILARTAHVAPTAEADDGEASGTGPAPDPATGAGPPPDVSQDDRRLDEETRLALLDRIARLRAIDPDQAGRILADWKAISGPSLARPSIETGATKVEAELLRRLLDQAEAFNLARGRLVPTPDVAEEAEGPTPTDVLDDTPESRGLDPEPEGDPGRPF